MEHFRGPGFEVVGVAVGVIEGEEAAEVNNIQDNNAQQIMLDDSVLFNQGIAGSQNGLILGLISVTFGHGKYLNY